MRKRLGIERRFSHVWCIRELAKRNKIVRRHEDDLRSFAELRNAIVHNPDSDRWQPLADPHEGVVQLYERIYQVLADPMTAGRVARPVGRLVAATLDDDLIDVMREMARRGFSQVPILEEGVVKGVFSESTPAAIVLAHGPLDIREGVTLEEFEDCLGLERAINEHFAFMPSRALAEDVEDAFVRAYSSKKRLGAIFVTQNGEPHERLLGMITASDVAGLELD